MSSVEPDEVREGQDLPETSYAPSMKQLFLYAASTWNAHRIHYDHVYSTQIEGYENIVVQGPLIADFFTQHVIGWLGDRGELVDYEYSNRSATYLGETLIARSSVQSIDRETGRVRIAGHIENGRGEIVLPAEATVLLRPKR